MDLVAGMLITNERISDLLCCALDSHYGSSYSWCRIAKRAEPTTWEFDSGAEDNCHYSYDFALNPGGALIIIDTLEGDDEELRLDLNSIQKGLGVLAAKYPHHFDDFMKENEDAVTGDVFLQCCLLGEVIYG